MKFNELRTKYNEFIYHGYDINYTDTDINIIYNFEIKNLIIFNPKLSIPYDKSLNKDKKFIEYLIFHIGLVELISYWKCCCPKNVIVEPFKLDDNQINFFKKLYFLGLGEFFYTNKIETTIEDFMNIKSTSNKTITPTTFNGKGALIPIGGGKDSCVTLDILKNEEDNLCFAINPKEVHMKCVKAAGYNNILEVKRTLDKKLIDLNNQGFLNGHTPFSSLVSFISYLCAYLYDKKYITLSNEFSANESTVLGTNINHQYSKTYEYENDFHEYTKEYFKIDIEYFSLLRSLSEYQIGYLFSKLDKFHTIFKSCNVGSKKEPWAWCCNCPKCLFVYSILSPFLYKDKLINIFGSDMFENKELLTTFKELLGYAKTKPFECVGTTSEVRYAISKTIINLQDNKLPYLLQYYKDNYELVDIKCENLENQYNDINNLNEHFTKLVKDKLLNPKLKEYFYNKFNNKNIAILGFGREGKSTYKLLRKYLPNLKITIIDKNEIKKLEDNLISYVTGDNYLDNLNRYDYIIKTPGISLNYMNIEDFKDRITSETEIALELFHKQIIGITGTKGKSTTSSLIYNILKNQFKDVIYCGNIGIPIFDEIEKINDNTTIVFELSSHQLEYTTHSPHISIITNLYEDHLDHAKTIEHYHQNKLNIFKYQNNNDYAIYAKDNDYLKQYIKTNTYKGKLISVNVTNLDGDIILKDNKVLENNKELYDTTNERLLIGNHNLENIMFALSVSEILNLNLNKTINTINNFKPLKYRLENLGTYNNITYYSDTLAIIPKATINALESIKNVDTLIFGGMDRGIDYTELINYLKESSVHNLICMPKTGYKVADALKEYNLNKNIIYTETLESAVKNAKKYTRPNMVCILSPAAASYEYFKNYAEKGDKFEELIKKENN